MLELVLSGIFVFIGVFVVATAGFGSALVIMPLLALIVPMEHARALMVLIMLITGPALIWNYRRSIQMREIWPLMIGSVPGAIVGVYVPNFVGATPVLIVAGIVLMAYAIYALTAPRVPTLYRRGWGPVFGLASGLLYGSFNIGGPPVVVYGTSRQWMPNTLRAHVQVQGFLVGLFVAAGHLSDQNITQEVLINLAFVTPFLFAAIYCGVRLNRYINATLFRRIVLLLLIVLGLQLIVSGALSSDQPQQEEQRLDGVTEALR